jgi:hypothetical protein
MRVLAVGGLLLTTLVFTLSAYADDPDPSKPTSIEFMDKGKLTVDLKWLMDRPESEKGKLPIWIHNSTTETQKVRLSLEGFVPTLSTAPYADKLEDLRPPSPEQELAPGATEPITLDFKAFTTAVFSETTSFPGVLVATSHPGGDVIRREFELKVEVTKDEPPKVLGLGDLPKDLERLTFPGTNYLPSIFNPLYPAVFWFVVAILLLLLARRLPWKTPTEGTKTLGWIFVGLVVVVAMALAVGRITKKIGTGPEWGMVVVKPIKMPVSAELKTAEEEEPEGEEYAAESASAPATTPTPTHGMPVGVVTADDRVATVVKHDDRLEVVGITRAGKYESKIDLLPGDDDKAEVSFTVNVADWWLFAFVAIALGVVVGYGLTKYYSQEQSSKRHRTRYCKLWQQAASIESLFLERNSGCPQAGYTIMRLFQQWIDEKIEVRISGGEFEKSKELLDKMESYIDQFAVFLRKLEKLYSLRSTLIQQFDKHYADPVAGSVINDVPAYELAGETLRGSPFVFPRDGLAGIAEDEDGKALKEIADKVDTQTGLLELLIGALQDIDKWIAHAEKAKETVDSDKLRPKIDALKEHGRTALQQTATTEIENARRAAQKVHDEIVRLIIDTIAAEIKAAEDRGVQPMMISPLRIMLESFAAEEKEELRKRAEREPEPTPPAVSSIRWQVWTPDDDGPSSDDRCIGDSNDLFTFSADIKVPSEGTDDFRVRWRFSKVSKDGTTKRVTEIETSNLVKVTEDMVLQTRHRFGKSGLYEVAIQDGKGKFLGAPREVRIQPEQGRWERLLVEFRVTETQMTFISGILAVSTGLLTLYSPTPTWGAPADYLKAFLWGSLVSETTKAGAKVVTSLVQRKWPLGGA